MDRGKRISSTAKAYKAVFYHMQRTLRLLWASKFCQFFASPWSGSCNNQNLFNLITNVIMFGREIRATSQRFVIDYQVREVSLIKFICFDSCIDFFDFDIFSLIQEKNMFGLQCVTSISKICTFDYN